MSPSALPETTLALLASPAMSRLVIHKTQRIACWKADRRIRQQRVAKRRFAFPAGSTDGSTHSEVFIMGEQIVQPNANSPHAAKTAHRRFTDVWKRIDGSWRLAIRQPTYTQVV